MSVLTENEKINWLAERLVKEYSEHDFSTLLKLFIIGMVNLGGQIFLHLKSLRNMVLNLKMCSLKLFTEM